MRPLRPLILLAMLGSIGVGTSAADAPGDDEDPALARAEAYEGQGALLEAAAIFEALCRTQARESDACWRAARSHWRFGERLSLAGHPASFDYFQEAEKWSGEGLERHPRCGECALWKYASLGRLVDKHGKVWAARNAREMRRLLDLGIEVRPQHVDRNGNHTLANLYYASSIFYRMVPESLWIRIFFGVRGDTDRALEHIQLALGYAQDRVDYHIEHGAILLCQGNRHRRPESTTEGKAALRHALSLPVSSNSDVVDRAFARQMLREPDKACGFTRKGFMDLEAESRRVRAQRQGPRGAEAAVSAPPPAADPG